MAEGGNSLSATLTKKVGGVPVYVIALLGVLLLALYLRSRKSSKATEDTTATDSSAASKGGTVPIAGAMPWTADVFMNQTKKDEAVVPSQVTLRQSTKVEDFVQKMNAAYPGLNLTSEQLFQMNPQVWMGKANSRGYISPTNPELGPMDPTILTLEASTDKPQAIRIK